MQNLCCLLIIYVFLLQVVSCGHNLKTTTNVHQYNNDTIIEQHEWGSEQIILLGIITIDSVVYKVRTFERTIEVADGQRKRRFLSFETLNTIYKYEVEPEHFLFKGIKDNKLIIGDNHCEEEIISLGEELLCFDCLNNRCLLR